MKSHPDSKQCEAVGKTLLRVLRASVVYRFFSKFQHGDTEITESTRRDSIFPTYSSRGAFIVNLLLEAARGAVSSGDGMPRLRRSACVTVFVLSLVSLYLPVASALAKEAQPAEDPQIEQRMKNLTQQLRCLVCQNETLADSQADLAEDLRREIRTQMKAGKTDQEILAYLTQRYGDFVLYKPPIKSTTYLLWFGPFAFLIIGVIVLYRYVRHRKELIPENPLTAAERRRAEELLRT